MLLLNVHVRNVYNLLLPLKDVDSNKKTIIPLHIHETAFSPMPVALYKATEIPFFSRHVLTSFYVAWVNKGLYCIDCLVDILTNVQRTNFANQHNL